MAKSYAQFMQGGTLLNHVPSIDLGAFDVEFDPAAGTMKIVVKFALAAAATTPSNQTLHVGTEVAVNNQLRFAQIYQQQIPTAWNGKVSLISTKNDDDWAGATLIPSFEARQSALADAHYQVTVIPESEEQHTQRDPTGIVTPDPINTNLGFQPRSAHMGSQSIEDVGMENYGKNMRWDLDKGVTIPIALDATSNTWSPASDAAGWSRLQAYVRNTLRFKVPHKFRSSSRPKVVLTVSGATSQQDNMTLANGIHTQLKAIAFKNPVTCASGATSGDLAVELKMDKTELKNLFPPRTAEKNSLYKQITTAHEYGHMLGLPDEYLCMHQRTQDAMSEVYSEQITESLKGNAGNKITDNAEAHIVNHQVGYVRLCAEAGVVAPPFNRLSSSIMSNGMVLHPWHFVTVWESLKKFSETSDWRIVMI